MFQQLNGDTATEEVSSSSHSSQLLWPRQISVCRQTPAPPQLSVEKSEKRVELEQQRAELDQQLMQIKSKRSIVESELQQLIEIEEKNADLKQLNNIYDYLAKHVAYFDGLRMKRLNHAVHAWGIECYRYNLGMAGLDMSSATQCSHMYHKKLGKMMDVSNMCLESVPLPKNDVEKKLYPHVVAYLQPHLPIAFECYIGLHDEDCYSVRPKKSAPIHFNLADGAYLYMYHLSR